MSTELLTSDEMRRADALTIASGVDSFALMQNAGAAVADVADEILEQRDGASEDEAEPSVLVVCGRGNNGGDGFIAATELLARGRDVRVMLLCKRDSLTGDAARAAGELTGEVEHCNPAKLGQPALIIDALLGTGLDREVKGDFKAIIEAINASHAQNGVPVLAVDIPSGVNGTTGEVMGTAIHATETVTFFRQKSGHLLMPGRSHCGTVRLADIGIADKVLDEIKPRTFANTTDLWRAKFPLPGADAHKYDRGHALVVSGPMASCGAARLAARGALRGGAGLVSLASPDDALAVNATASLAVMVKAAGTPAALGHLLQDRRFKACVIGPGLGVGVPTKARVEVALKAGCACVFDADALTSFMDEADALFALTKENPQRDVILTPHDGEFARLFAELVPLPKLDRAREAARHSGAVVVLKGADTVIASPDGRAAINANARPWLATAGAGDVLAGMCAAMLAQGVPAFEAACIAVWMHGEASQEAGPGMIAEDIPEVLPAVFRRLYTEFGMSF